MIKSCQSKILFFVILSLVARTMFALEIPGPMVDSDWLAEHLGEVKILDVREDIDSYTRSRIGEKTFYR